MTTFEKARIFIYQNARPLDLARFRYHFENGGREAVLTALACYQNEDGGFGHALEADSWNPNSSPIQTWVATEILHEIDFTDQTHPIIQGILRYLESGKDFDGHFWYNTVRSNNDYPHAPWWHTESDSTCHNDYNPTACLAGFIVRYSEKGSDLYGLGCRIAKEAYTQLLDGGRQNDMHTLSCYIRLAEYIKASGSDCVDISALEAKLRESVKATITQNKAEWENGYICKPSQFFCDKSSMFYDDNKEIADYECGFIERTQLKDGSWNIPWGWSDYPEQWAISKNWWKSNGIIQNLLYLSGIAGNAVPKGFTFIKTSPREIGIVSEWYKDESVSAWISVDDWDEYYKAVKDAPGYFLYSVYKDGTMLAHIAGEIIGGRLAIAVIVDPAKHGHGLGTAVVCDMQRHTAELFGDITGYEACIFPGNTASVRCFEKSGFVYEKDGEDGEKVYFHKCGND